MSRPILNQSRWSAFVWYYLNISKLGDWVDSAIDKVGARPVGPEWLTSMCYCMALYFSKLNYYTLKDWIIVHCTVMYYSSLFFCAFFCFKLYYHCQALTYYVYFFVIYNNKNLFKTKCYTMFCDAIVLKVLKSTAMLCNVLF